jgi:hypothetical protein
VVDERGERVAVLLSIDEHERLTGSAQSVSFWDAPTISDLASSQGIQPVIDPTMLPGDFWPGDESVDAFLTERRIGARHP